MIAFRVNADGKCWFEDPTQELYELLEVEDYQEYLELEWKHQTHGALMWGT